MTLFRTNWSLARALDLEIQEAREALHEAQGDPNASGDDIRQLRAELYDLEHQFFMTGATSEYEP
jgi:hypothetical protein